MVLRSSSSRARKRVAWQRSPVGPGRPGHQRYRWTVFGRNCTEFGRNSTVFVGLGPPFLNTCFLLQVVLGAFFDPIYRRFDLYDADADACTKEVFDF